MLAPPTAMYVVTHVTAGCIRIATVTAIADPSQSNLVTIAFTSHLTLLLASR
jgi:hypothetical protein